MLARYKMGIRFFLLGLALGLLTAPRSGRMTRRMIVKQVSSLLSVPSQEIPAPFEETAELIGVTVHEMQQPD